LKIVAEITIDPLVYTDILRFTKIFLSRLTSKSPEDRLFQKSNGSGRAEKHKGLSFFGEIRDVEGPLFYFNLL
jgi:hypothetical protein